MPSATMFPSDDDVPASLLPKPASIEGQLMHPSDADADVQKMLADFHASVRADKAAEAKKRAECSEADLMFLEDAELGKGGEATVLMVQYCGKYLAYKKSHLAYGTGEKAVAVTAQEATAEFKALSRVYKQAVVVTSPAGKKQRNVVKPVRMVTDPAHGGQVSGFLMKLIEGGSLMDNLGASPAWKDASPSAPCPLTVRAAACIGAQVCRGALAFHRANLVHLDIKPHNFLLKKPVEHLNDITLDNEVLLVDGGLVSAGPGPLQRRMPCSPIVGTPHFMAPEQLNDASQAFYSPCPAMDDVAVGRTCLYLFTWQMPGQDMSNDDIAAANRDGTLMSRIHPQCALPAPAAFLNVALWLAHADPTERLSVEAALPIFLYIHDRAAAGHEVTLEDVQARFSLQPHPLLRLYPTTERPADVPVAVERASDSPGLSGSASVAAEARASPGCISADTGTLEAEETASLGESGGAHGLVESTAPRVTGPSFADLHCNGSDAVMSMAVALLRSSGPGAQRRSSGKGMYPTVPEIKRAVSGPHRALSTLGSEGIVELASEDGGSQRISAFGERITVASCAGLADAEEVAADAVSVKACEQEELWPAAEVASEDAQRNAGLLRRMRALWASSRGRISAAMLCRGIAVQE